jgi:3D (Asp-Asp-Asp) domain-containing protein
MWEVEPPKVMLVRITAYWCGQDAWTSKMQSSTGRRLVSGKSCAVDPYVIPYGSYVTIKETGKVVRAIDTGTAVVNRKSEWSKPKKKRLPVIDLFFKTQKEADMPRWKSANRRTNEIRYRLDD